jgi:hypothetical protein
VQVQRASAAQSWNRASLEGTRQGGSGHPQEQEGVVSGHRTPTRNRLRLAKRRRVHAAARRSGPVPSRTQPGANFRRLRAQQSKGTSRRVGRDSRQSQTLGRTAQPSVISLREAPISPGHPANPVTLRLPGRRLRNLGKDDLALPTHVRRAGAERGRARPREEPSRPCCPQRLRSHSIRPAFDSFYPNNQQAPEQVGARRLPIALGLNSLSLT